MPAARYPWTIQERQDLEGDFPTFLDALRTYFERTGAQRPAVAAIAVAGPVTDGTARFTNRGWNISEATSRNSASSERCS